jgi:hypothetical protein
MNQMSRAEKAQRVLGFEPTGEHVCLDRMCTRVRTTPVHELRSEDRMPALPYETIRSPGTGGALSEHLIKGVESARENDAHVEIIFRWQSHALTK